MGFICMLALQLAGSLILLLNCSIGSKKTIIKNCFPGSNIAPRGENDNVTIPKEELWVSAHKFYVNAVAFMYLVIGYFIAAFSPVAPHSKCNTVIGAFVFTLVLLVAGYYISRFAACHAFPKDEIVPYHQLEENGVDTSLTPAEIDAVIYDTSER